MQTTLAVTRGQFNSLGNGLQPEDASVHRWYRFVLAFPPHLVRAYLDRFAPGRGCQVLDPFCGTGTTLVECIKCGIDSIGLEANPVVAFASRVKTNWTPNPAGLAAHARQVADLALAELRATEIEDVPLLFQSNAEPSFELRTLPPESAKLLIKDAVSPLPMHKLLVLREAIDRLHDPRFIEHERLALANVAVHVASNLRFGPEVGLGTIKSDEAVVHPWLSQVRAMAEDLADVQRLVPGRAQVHLMDAREAGRVLEPGSIEAVITSPPYPNEKDYTRTTRLESVLLGYTQTRADLTTLKRSLVRSNTRGVYAGDQDDAWVTDFPRIQALAQEIEVRRIALGKTSGFERMYARVTTLYFGGMARHLAELRPFLRPGAMLVYIVGDQASYLRVMIRTGEILGEIAASLGYEVLGRDLFRTRFATATQQYLNEEALLLRWPGTQGEI